MNNTKLKSVITGENGCFLALSELNVKDGYLSALVTINSSWYSANVKFESSYERMQEFITLLDKLVSQEINNVTFINDDGNVDINFSLNHSGKVIINGCLLNDMMDESSLKYEIESDLQSLDDFYLTLKNSLYS
ncbi:hypothetical protein [Morganella morganii]|uniref:hypothetical protein n=1 Tax=Morganella morganii TaxID=582 RepID=UPI00339CAF58